MVTFDGVNSLIVLSGATSFTAMDIYTAAKQWDAQQNSMNFVCPLTAVGMAPLGSGAFTDAVFTLQNNWKFQPSGYAPGTQIVVSGTVVTSDGSSRTVVPSVGAAVTWIFQVSSSATVVSTSGGGTVVSGLTPDEQAALASIAGLPDLIRNKLLPLLS